MKNDLCSKDYSRYVDINQYKDKNPNKKIENLLQKKTLIFYGQWLLISIIK